MCTQEEPSIVWDALPALTSYTTAHASQPIRTTPSALCDTALCSVVRAKPLLLYTNPHLPNKPLSLLALITEHKAKLQRDPRQAFFRLLHFISPVLDTDLVYEENDLKCTYDLSYSKAEAGEK